MSVCHGVRPLVDPFRSHVSRSHFRGLPLFLLPVGELCFIILSSLSRGILFTRCIQFLLYPSSLSRTGVISNSFAMCKFVNFQRLKVATLPLDLPCSGPVTHLGEISTTGKSHGKKPDRFSLNDDTDAGVFMLYKIIVDTYMIVHYCG